MTWQQLKDSFKEYGEIVRADVAETRNVLLRILKVIFPIRVNQRGSGSWFLRTEETQ